jgi:DNA-binding FadR family transcriptional regulator
MAQRLDSEWVARASAVRRRKQLTAASPLIRTYRAQRRAAHGLYSLDSRPALCDFHDKDSGDGRRDRPGGQRKLRIQRHDVSRTRSNPFRDTAMKKKTRGKAAAKQGRSAPSRKAASRVQNAIRPPRPGKRIHGRIADDLGIAILSGRHAPGELLPTEVEASERLGVSRTAYREAIRILAAKGLVESRPKAGTRVTERHHWRLLDTDVLSWIFNSEPSESFIQGLFELREIVEPQAAALAAKRRSSDQLAAMGHALEEMDKYGLATPEGRAADQTFHEEILKATANEPLVTLTSTIGAAIQWTTFFKQRRRKLPRNPMPEHRKLYAAIAEGNAERAMSAARELIRLALKDTKDAL